MAYSHNVFQSQRNFEAGARVEQALMQFDETRFDGISVTAFCGIVELSGTVSNFFDKAIAIRLAGQVAGVSTVVESLQIRSESEVHRSLTIRRPRQIHLYYSATSDRTTTMRQAN